MTRKCLYIKRCVDLKNIFSGGILMNNPNTELHEYYKWILSDDYSVIKNSRAGGTIANFGTQMKFDLSKEIPLFNTKRTFYRGVIEEMIFFFNGPAKDGNLHIDYLLDKECNFWNKDLHNFYSKKQGIKFTSDEERDEHFKWFEEKIKIDPEFRKKNGSLGRPYGAQWRDWKGTDQSIVDVFGYGFVKKAKPIDQLANTFEDLKKLSDSRRLIVTAWKPDEMNNMALPPCHKDFQFVVMGDRLDIAMGQRSADSFLGVVFNSFQYTIMGMLGAAYAGLKPGVLTHQLTDAHIYCGRGEKVEWYKENFKELKDRIKSAKVSQDYLDAKEWIDSNSRKHPNPEYELYDHVTGVLQQLSRDPYKYPIAKLEVIIDRNQPAKQMLNNLRSDNFKVTGYDGNHYPGIKRYMATG
jgi:thymidylate synthase